MSLHRCEQMVYDYWVKQPEERNFWQSKVCEAIRSASDPLATARLIERELWRYFVERSGQVEPFKQTATRHGLERVSMLNLAELLIRLWSPPPQRRQS